MLSGGGSASASCDPGQTAAIQASFDDAAAIPGDVVAVALGKDACGFAREPSFAPDEPGNWAYSNTIYLGIYYRWIKPEAIEEGTSRAVAMSGESALAEAARKVIGGYAPIIGIDERTVPAIERHYEELQVRLTRKGSSPGRRRPSHSVAERGPAFVIRALVAGSPRGLSCL